jgi:hypothetical protein
MRLHMVGGVSRCGQLFDGPFDFEVIEDAGEARRPAKSRNVGVVTGRRCASKITKPTEEQRLASAVLHMRRMYSVPIREVPCF